MYRKGVNLVEIIMATTVFSIVVFTFIAAISYGVESIVLAGDRSQAAFLAEEGLEVVRNIKDSDFENLVSGNYGVDTSGTRWALSGSADTSGEFSREIVLTELSENVYEAESRVSWDQTGLRPGEVAVTSRFSNWTVETDDGILDWANPVLSSNSNLTGSGDGWKIDVVGDIAYIVKLSGTLDFIVVDVSDSQNPTVYYSTSLLSGARDIKVVGDYAYIATTNNSSEILVYNISNPSFPILVESLNLSGSNDAYALDIVGNVLHVVRQGGNEQYVTVDISNPLNLSVLATLDLSGNSRDLYIKDGLAYVGGTDNSDDLSIVDVSDVNNVSLAGVIDLAGGGDIDAVAGYDDYLFLGDSSGFVRVYDITDRLNPVLVSSYDALDDVNDMVLGVNNSLLFLATDENNSEIQILDVSDLTAPFLLGSYDTIEDMNGAAYSSVNDRFYAVGDDNIDEFVILEPS